MTVIVVCKQSWHFDFINIITVCFRDISKDLEPKPNDNCQTGSEQASVRFIVMAAELRPGMVF